MINKINTPTYEIVYSLNLDSKFGWLITAYAIQLTEGGHLSLKNIKLVPRNLGNFGEAAEKEHSKNVSLIDECSFVQLHKKFCTKKNLKPSQFIDSCSDEYISMFLKPHIEVRMSAVLENLKGKNIYLSDRLNPANKCLKINTSSSRTEFTFKLKPEKNLEYKLLVYNNDQLYDIESEENHIIYNEDAWSIIGDEIHFFDNGIDGKKIAPFFTKSSINIPSNSVKTYLQKFVKPLISNQIVHSIGFDIEEKLAETKAVWLIRNAEKIKIIPLFKYQNEYLKFQDKRDCFVEFNPTTFNFIKLKRQKNEEQFYLEFLKTKLLEHFNVSSVECNSIDDLLVFLSKNYEEIKSKNISLLFEGFECEYILDSPKIHISFTKIESGYKLVYKANCGDYSIPIGTLKRALFEEQRFIKLADKYLLIPIEWFSKYRQIFSHLKKQDSNYYLTEAQVHLLGNFEISNKNDKAASNTKHVNNVSLELIPEHQTLLRTYQKTGFNWLQNLYNSHFGGCLADDMGLGKTLQTIALLSSIYTIEDHNQTEQIDLFTFSTCNQQPSLIVMPTSLIHNWKNELSKFAPNLKVLNYSSSNRSQDEISFKRHHIILTSYGIIRNDLEFLKKIAFKYLILDESHAIKNPVSKISKAVNELNVQHKLTLTGTPIENSLTDLWSQMNFLNPGLLGSYSFFKQEYVLPIEKYNQETKIPELKKLIGPYILRRTKEEVAPELPELTEQILTCEMSKKQRQLYENIRSQYKSQILDNIEKEGINKNRFAILKGLMELRLIANHPRLFDDKTDFSSGKFNFITDKINLLHENGHKILIFSQFVKHLKIIEEFLVENKFMYSMLTGSTRNREEVIDKFNTNTKCNIFLISLKSGGFGLNLTKADYVFILDPWWNPFAEKQAIDRAYRIGQVQNVFSYKFITENSIEDKILKLQRKKKRLASDFITLNSSWSKELDEEDVKTLFT